MTHPENYTHPALLKGVETLTLLNGKGQPEPSLRMVRPTTAAAKAQEIGYAYRFSRPASRSGGREMSEEARRAHRANKAGLFVAQEMEVAQLATQQLVLEGTLPQQGRFPILYSPDGGIPTGQGMKRAVEWFSEAEAVLAPVIKPAASSGASFALPAEALELARQSGVLVVCDSIVDKGRTFRQILDALPEDFTTEAGDPIRLVFYANIGIRKEKPPGAKGKAPSVFSLNAAEVLLSHPRWRELGAELVVSDITDQLLQEAERGGALARGAHPVTSPLQRYLTRPARIRTTRPMPEPETALPLQDWQAYLASREQEEVAVER